MKLLKILIFGLMVILISEFIYSQQVLGVSVDPSSSAPVCPGTQTQSTVTANLNNPNNISTTVTFFVQHLLVLHVHLIHPHVLLVDLHVQQHYI